MYSNKVVTGRQRGKRSKCECSIGESNRKPSEKVVMATPCNGIQYDNIRHWKEPVE